MHTIVRLAATGLAVAGLALVTIVAQAQDWPSKPVKIIVPSAAGGSSDTAARFVANHFHETFKQPFIVENRPGGGNALGAAFVAKQEPDGYTLLISNTAANLTVPLVSKTVGYDPVADFTHIVMLSGAPYALAVNPSLGVKTLDEFVAMARASAKPLTYTAANPGGLGHMGGEYFKQLAKIDMLHVPYRGGGPALSDVVAGHVPAIFLPLSTIGEQVRAGKLIALAVTARQRVASYPDIPTFIQAGYPDLVYSSWFGLSAPKGLPAEIVTRLNAEARAFLQTPKMKEVAEREASDILDSDSAGFSKMIADDVARWSRVIQSTGIKLE